MSVTANLYGGFALSLAEKQVNLNSDTIKVMLLTSSYTPSDSHRYQSDLTNEVTGTGYTAGGQALSGVSLSYSSSVLTFSASNVTWSTSTISAQYAVLVDTTPGSSSTNPLIGYVNFGTTVSDTAGTFQIQWSGSGIFQLTIN
jgi:hypothetical protein